MCTSMRLATRYYGCGCIKFGQEVNGTDCELKGQPGHADTLVAGKSARKEGSCAAHGGYVT
ncbi:hypothetical protein BU24DRAFT_417562 [Aaosphaeria arxii CBS 175.79]|uniref:Uncharacterized protein n=1 Tax=Aaosphaeria arxii CBS 175.79 TaxID=1450172 RepID=A0A6A5Y8L5_9PLEO|nr:uncharacterized protein BU24DRAFT_417562 [Aaosphaeria arxii CBS 175.79]KAF2021915.1 hypothetical protein BU24DRAFT_417562 [Aaosphaeria arxii CBS 175.79]